MVVIVIVAVVVVMNVVVIVIAGSVFVIAASRHKNRERRDGECDREKFENEFHRNLGWGFCCGEVVGL